MSDPRLERLAQMSRNLIVTLIKDFSSFALMHAMGANTAGQSGSVIAGGVLLALLGMGWTQRRGTPRLFFVICDRRHFTTER